MINIKLKEILMKRFTKIVSCMLGIVLLFNVTACGTTKCSHSFSSEITKAATCKETGIKTYTCSICGDSYTEEIPQLTTHSYTYVITKTATCEKNGEIKYTCIYCGKSITQEIAKYGHDLNRNGNCTICGHNSTITLDMNETEKNNASKIKALFYVNGKKLSTDNSGNYIFSFVFSSSSDQIDKTTCLTTPVLIDITITDNDGVTIYAKTKELKSVDFKSEKDYLVGNIKVNVDELSNTNVTLSKLYLSIYVPGYARFDEIELSVPAIIVIPDLPKIISYRLGGDLAAMVKITDISYEISYSNFSSLYFTGEKIYDKNGSSYSRGCYVGYKLYDSEGYLIESDNYLTESLKVGEKFRNDKELAFSKKIERGKIYRLQLLNVG